MDMRLYEAARTGDVTSLRALLEENELILDRFLTENVPETPLHIAFLSGHAGFAKEILSRKPQQAYVLSSRGLSPLYMASENGYADIVELLLPLTFDVSHDRDRNGRTPLHAAVIKGRLDVLEKFKRIKPESIGDLTDQDETVLHLCVKYNQLDALKTLIGFVGNDIEFVNQKDENGNTILHLAAMKKRIPMMDFLIKEDKVEINTMNMNGLTALDIFAPCPTPEDTKMVNSLQCKGAKRSWEMSRAKADNELQNVLIVVGALTATLSFQAALTPPGGLWQDDSNMGFNNTLQMKNHTAGTSILADKKPRLFLQFQSFNLLVFFTSLFLILIGASPVKTAVSRKKLVAPMLQILLFALACVSGVIYLCNKAHTPIGLPHDISWQVNVSYSVLSVGSLILCFLLSIFNLMTRRHWLRR